MNNKLEFKNIGGGIKGINFEVWGGIDNFLTATSTGAVRSTLLRRVVPWMAKANNMTANAISDLPFCLYKGKEEYDTSAAWQNNLGGISNPKRLIYLLASSLCGGKAYLIPTVTSSQILELHYCAPHTVSELISVNGLENFTRTSDSGSAGVYTPAGEEGENEMMYFWLPDSDIELGPAKCFPMSTAMISTEILVNMDATLRGYSERGFIPPTILAAKGMPGAGEREKTEAWWNKFLRGWTNTTAKVINSEAMDVKQIGAGFESLNGVYKDLSRQMIENIGASHGIPGALFMSDMAFASEFNAMVKFWYTTSEFISIYHCIEETFNEQLFDRFGVKMQFKPETIDAFQNDETSRATSYVQYTGAQMRPSIAAEMLGLELPEGVDYEDLDEEFDKPDPVPVINQVMPKKVVDEESPKKKPQLDAQQIKDLDLWRQVATRNYAKGKGKATDFKCASLPGSIADPIRERLAKADNELEVLKSFDIGSSSVEVFYDFMPIYDALRLEINEIKSAPQPMNLTINNESGKAPQVTVKAAESPVINVAPAQVNPPVVNVMVTPSTATIENVVNLPEMSVENVVKVNVPKVKKAKVTRDRNGAISGIEEA